MRFDEFVERAIMLCMLILIVTLTVHFCISAWSL